MIRNYVIVTASYWGFTLVDGALRMLVLLHFFRSATRPSRWPSCFCSTRPPASSPISAAAGWRCASAFRACWRSARSCRSPACHAVGARSRLERRGCPVAWVVIAQGISGVAKDVTKTASKSAIKATSADGNGQLFRWVAWFTGSKNAMKGVGFFVGGLLLDVVGFRGALWLMAALLGVILFAGLAALPRELGKAKSSKTVRELFAKSRGVNLLAAARIFMFGARDVWFVVGLPVFLYANGWRFLEVGGFLALWTIGYGFIQAVAPSTGAPQRRRPEPRGARSAALGGWCWPRCRSCWRCC